MKQPTEAAKSMQSINIQNKIKHSTNGLIFETEQTHKYREQTCGGQGLESRGEMDWSLKLVDDTIIQRTD